MGKVLLFHSDAPEFGGDFVRFVHATAQPFPKEGTTVRVDAVASP